MQTFLSIFWLQTWPYIQCHSLVYQFKSLFFLSAFALAALRSCLLCRISSYKLRTSWCFFLSLNSPHLKTRAKSSTVTVKSSWLHKFKPIIPKRTRVVINNFFFALFKKKKKKNPYKFGTVRVKFPHFLSHALRVSTRQKEKCFTSCVTLWSLAAYFPKDVLQFIPPVTCLWFLVGVKDQGRPGGADPKLPNLPSPPPPRPTKQWVPLRRETTNTTQHLDNTHFPSVMTSFHFFFSFLTTAPIPHSKNVAKEVLTQWQISEERSSFLKVAFKFSIYSKFYNLEWSIISLVLVFTKLRNTHFLGSKMSIRSRWTVSCSFSWITGEDFWRTKRDGSLVSLNPAKIKNFWIGLPPDTNRIDAVYERKSDSHIIFFIGGLSAAVKSRLSNAATHFENICAID